MHSTLISKINARTVNEREERERERENEERLQNCICNQKGRNQTSGSRMSSGIRGRKELFKKWNNNAYLIEKTL